MKFCGCNSCQQNGETNPYEEFEVYLNWREDELRKEFSEILAQPFSAAELNDMEAQFEPEKKTIVERIKEYDVSENTWRTYMFWYNYAKGNDD